MPDIAPNSIVIDGRSGRLSEADLQLCVERIRQGELVVVPTETVYGVGSHAFHPASIAAIYELKGRSYKKPLPLLLGDASQLNLVAQEILPEAKRLMQIFWPGALTLVFKTAPLAMPATRGKDTVAVRIPDHPVMRAILVALGFPLATTSANPSGKVASRRFEEAHAMFHGKVGVLVNGGPCEVAVESTVVDVTHYPFTVVREGALSKTQIERALS